MMPYYLKRIPPVAGFATSGLLLAGMALAGRTASAQSSNGIVALVQETLAASAGRIGTGGPASLMAVLGDPIGGPALLGTYTIHPGYQGIPSTLPPGSRMIAVEGTTDEPVASASVNGVPATVAGTLFRTEGIRLVEGLNTITVTAVDGAGNTATKPLTVTLNTHPPARPTIAALSAVTTDATHTLTGTKTPGTSVWVSATGHGGSASGGNGIEVVPLNDSTIWTATMPLTEGDNTFVIVTKNATGNTSTSVTVTMIVDDLPPVVTCTPPTKTNITPVLLTGSVDDHLTTVTINGIAATRTGRNFQRSVPLTPGPNAFRLVATSPNGYVTQADYTVTLGTIPALQAVQPLNGTKWYAGTPVRIQATAVDSDGDPIAYRFAVDGSVLSDWGFASTQTWTPDLIQRGPHTLTIDVRDNDGGSRSQDVNVFVLRRPVQHP